MKSQLHRIFILLNLACFTFFSGCNNRDWYPEVGPPLNSYVKYINAIPQSNLDFYAYYTRVTRGVLYGKDQPYTNSPNGNIVIYTTNANQTTNRATGTTSAATPQMNAQGFVPEYYQTLIACKQTDSTNTDDLILMRDNLAPPAGGMAHVRFVYLTQKGTSKTKLVDVKAITSGEGSKMLFTSIKYRTPSNAVLIDPSKGLNTPGLGVFTSGPFAAVPAGTYDLDVVDASNTNSVVNKPGIKLETGKIYTIYTSGKIGDQVAVPTMSIINHN